MGNITEYDVDVNTSRNKVITDRLGNKTAYEYDVNGRTTRVTSKTADNAEIANVAYSYDATDNLSEIMRGDGLKYVLKYNAFKNLESIGIAGKDEKLVNYTYKTSGGRLKEITYANGHKMRASYNRTGNMIAERWYNSDDLLTAYYRYSYDAQGNIVRSVDIFARKEYNYYYEDGVLARSVESDILIDECDFIISKTAVVTVVYVYSDDGELIKKRVIFAGGTEQEFGYQTEQAEDAAEDTQSTTTIETETETSTEIKNESGENGTHDEVIDGEISEENSWNSPSNATSTVQTKEEAEEYKEKVTFKMGETEFVSRSDYDGFGRKSFDELKLKKGFISRQFSYHAGKVTEVHKQKNKLQSAPVTQLVSQIILSDGRTLNYEYDKEERVTKVTDSFEGTTEYTYDALGQLLTETKNGEVVNVMTYDNYGNILSKNDVVYGYADPVWKDKLTKFDGLDITYDSQGNPLNYLGHNLTWEKGRQLKSYDDNTYTYNANGIRTSKTVGGIRHDFVLDGAKILKETWENNTLIPLYDNADEVCGIVYNDVPYYFIKNLQGDVIAIVNKDAQTVARYSYDAWGVPTIIQDFTDYGIASINPYRYRGYYYDEEIGMYYLQSRYYNPNVGRFVNGDEVMYLGLGSGLSVYNLFAYCTNNPIINFDPTGNASISSANKTRVEVCINTPNTNSSVVFAVQGRIFSAGHVFLKLHTGNNKTLKKKYGNCAFGFAPKSTSTLVVAASQVMLAYLYVKGKIQKENNSKYHTSVIINISQDQFETIYKYCTPKKAPLYNLVKFNCATFALKALDKAKVKHRFKRKLWNFGSIGLWVPAVIPVNLVKSAYFYGYTPAQMAYDIMKGKY